MSGNFHAGHPPDDEPHGIPLYLIAVHIKPNDAEPGTVVLDVLGGPAEGWWRVPVEQHPTLARHVSRMVTEYVANLNHEADLVDDVDALDADAIIAEHNRTTENNT